MPDVPDRPIARSRFADRDLGEAWNEHAADWIAWARAPEHDSYWNFHRAQFFELLPAAAHATLDVGCGEGRVSRDLTALGHRIVGVDRSEAMVAAARAASPELEFLVADSTALPFDDEAFDLVIAFMSLQDMEDMPGAVSECARVLAPGGRFCFAVVHPLNSAGRFAGDTVDAPFVIEGSYLDESYYADSLARGGLEMTFVSAHRPLQAYAAAVTDAGLVIDLLREAKLPHHPRENERSPRWRRVPLFLHVRALKRA